MGVILNFQLFLIPLFCFYYGHYVLLPIFSVGSVDVSVGKE